MQTTPSLRHICAALILSLLWIASVSASELELRLWRIDADDWPNVVMMLETTSGAGQTLIADGKALAAPLDAWTRFDERHHLVAIRDTAERLQALEKLLQITYAQDDGTRTVIFELQEGMALKTRDHLAHQLSREPEAQRVPVALTLFQKDLIVKAPPEKMADIENWVEAIQPRKVVAQEEKPAPREPRPVRQTVLSWHRTPAVSPYLTGRPSRGGFVAGYSESASATVSGMGRYGAAQSSTGISLYADDGLAIIDLRHQNSSYMLDAVNGYLDFSFGSSGRNLSFSNGVNSTW